MKEAMSSKILSDSHHIILPGETRTKQYDIYTMSFAKVSFSQHHIVISALNKYSKQAHGKSNGFVVAATSREDLETVVIWEAWSNASELDEIENVCLYSKKTLPSHF